MFHLHYASCNKPVNTPPLTHTLTLFYHDIMHHYADGIVAIRSAKIQAAHTRHRVP